MKNSKVEICFIGNAIVDILSKISNETLNKLKIPKGSMQLVDEESSDKILKYINEPDLLIYLRNLNIDKIISNIDKRSRKFEKSIDKEYLKKLNIYYENWIKKHPQEKILTIDLSEDDFIEDPKFLKKIYSMIEKKINELT